MPKPVRSTPAPLWLATGHSALPDFGRRLDGVVALVVEDHPESRDMLGHVLTAFGARPILTADGGAALAVLERERPDMILCDVILPDMNGLTLPNRLALDPRWRRIPVIAITACDTEAARLLAWAHGLAAYFSKPLDLLRLAAEIHRAARHQAEPDRRALSA